MKASRRVMLHKGNRTRFFDEGEEVPEDWAAEVVAENLLIDSDVDPASLLDPKGSMEDVIDWVVSGDDAGRLDRVREAIAAEQGGKQRSTLLATLEEMENGLLGVEVADDDEGEG